MTQTRQWRKLKVCHGYHNWNSTQKGICKNLQPMECCYIEMEVYVTIQSNSRVQREVASITLTLSWERTGNYKETNEVVKCQVTGLLIHFKWWVIWFVCLVYVVMEFESSSKDPETQSKFRLKLNESILTASRSTWTLERNWDHAVP